MQGDAFNSVATKEDLKVGFNFGFKEVVEHRQRMGEIESDPLLILKFAKSFVKPLLYIYFLYLEKI